LLVLPWTQGCARRVRLDAYALPGDGVSQFPAGSSFSVSPNPGMPNPIFDRMVKEKIETALRASGFQVNETGASYELQYDYGIEGREETRLSKVPGPFAGGRYRFVGGMGFDNWDPLYYSTIVADTYPVYTAHLRLRVLKNGQTQAPQEARAVWVGETSTESDERNLRELIDYLIAASARSLGRDTRKPVDVTVPEDDPVLKQLRGAAPAAPAASPEGS